MPSATNKKLKNDNASVVSETIIYYIFLKKNCTFKLERAIMKLLTQETNEKESFNPFCTVDRGVQVSLGCFHCVILYRHNKS